MGDSNKNIWVCLSSNINVCVKKINGNLEEIQAFVKDSCLICAIVLFRIV